MSDADNDLDDDAIEDGATGGNGNKTLRKQNSKLTNELEEARKEIAAFREKQRSGSIAEFLKAANASEKLAKHAARDIEGDVTEESVLAWLQAEGDAFGWSPDDAEVDPNVQQAERISRASSSAPPATSGMTVDKMKNMSFDDLIANGLIDP